MTILDGRRQFDGAISGSAMNGAGVDGIGMDSTPPPASEAQPDLVARRVDLEHKLDELRAELAATRARVADRDATLKRALREELMASRERLKAMESAHQERIEAIRRETQAQVDQIIADAQRQIGDLS
jgi:regulator of protease activity HflC (stomatin/prohibitin superfamily)